jgi:TolB-like protein/tetratricopeptide (TPR) repeat protein
VTEPNQAVFLSYASQDADAAQNLCNGLRAAGIEVWFDQSELRGGENWDRKINDQIRKCRLFIPVISKRTETRDEGYFRREWAAAVDRMRDMADHKPFLVPVVIDDIAEREAAVPERFRQVQWMRLPGGQPSVAFVNRIATLLGQSPSGTPADVTPRIARSVPNPRNAGHRTRWMSLGALGLAAALGGGWQVWQRAVTHSADHRALTTTVEPQGSDKSVAVLPFVDLSEKHDQEYFSDGLAEELLDLLSLVPDLKVPARTSSFYFRTHPTPAPEIAKSLGVRHLLEGSVRRSGDSLRVTVQLIRADTGYQLWSQTFDGATNDLFKVQDEIASTVARTLRAQLVPSNTLVGARQTSNQEAHDLFLRGKERYFGGTVESDRESISLFERAIAADPHYAAAYAALAHTRGNLMIDLGRRETPEEAANRFREAERAIQLGPNIGDGYAVRGITYLANGDWNRARDDLQKAVELDPKDARSLRFQARYFASQGNLVLAIATVTHAITLDPFDAYAWAWRAQFELADGERDTARSDLTQALRISPGNRKGLSVLAFVDIGDGRLDEATQLARALPSNAMRIPLESAIGCARGETRKALEILDHWKAGARDEGLALTVTAYSLCGQKKKALDTLETDVQASTHLLGETLEVLKYHSYFSALRAEPRYKALLRKVNLAE